MNPGRSRDKWTNRFLDERQYNVDIDKKDESVTIFYFLW